MRVSTKEAQHTGRDELASERDAAVCTYPGCGAGPGQLCVNPKTGGYANVPHMLHRKPETEPPAIGS